MADEANISAALESFCRTTCLALDADGILLLILHKGGERAEIIGGKRKDDTGDAQAATVAMLRRMADEIEAGGGLPVGDHGNFYPDGN